MQQEVQTFSWAWYGLVCGLSISGLLFALIVLYTDEKKKQTYAVYHVCQVPNQLVLSVIFLPWCVCNYSVRFCQDVEQKRKRHIPIIANPQK